MGRILVVDDLDEYGPTERHRTEYLRKVQNLVGSNHSVELETNPVAVRWRIEGDPYGYDLILLDQRMTGLSGIDLLRYIRNKEPNSRILPVIMLTRFTDVVRDSFREGANDYFIKDQILGDPGNEAEKRRFEDEINTLIKVSLLYKAPLDVSQARSELDRLEGFRDIIGVNDGFLEQLRQARIFADSDLPVLIFGETGTGKKLVARAIHRNSRRSHRILYEVSMGEIISTGGLSHLIDIVGHEPGYLYKGDPGGPGLFEANHGGTVFLDDIQLADEGVQGALLRVIEEKKVRRKGSPRSYDADVRLIVATNEDLEEKIRRGEFRDDLYYRIRRLYLELPPLRERKEDIPLLAQHFLEKICNREGVKMNISEDAVDCLMRYDWPGNVRQLENEIEGAFLLARERGEILPCHLSERISQRPRGRRRVEPEDVRKQYFDFWGKVKASIGKGEKEKLLNIFDKILNLMEREGKDLEKITVEDVGKFLKPNSKNPRSWMNTELRKIGGTFGIKQIKQHYKCSKIRKFPLEDS